MGRKVIGAATAIIVSIVFEQSKISFILSDGQTLDFSRTSFPTLASASNVERSNWQSCAAGRGIHWPSLDLDLCIDALLAGEGELPVRL